MNAALAYLPSAKCKHNLNCSHAVHVCDAHYAFYFWSSQSTWQYCHNKCVSPTSYVMDSIKRQHIWKVSQSAASKCDRHMLVSLMLPRQREREEMKPTWSLRFFLIRQHYIFCSCVHKCSHSFIAEQTAAEWISSRIQLFLTHITSTRRGIRFSHLNWLDAEWNYGLHTESQNNCIARSGSSFFLCVVMLISRAPHTMG